MWRGLYTAATGMISESYRVDSIANNLANANTTGFKRDDAVVKEFAPMLLHRIHDKNDKKNDITAIKEFAVNPGRVDAKQFSLRTYGPYMGKLGLGSQVDEIVTDHSQGVFQTTGNPLDVAITGNGYLAIDTPQGVRYTRDGNLYRSADGRLVNVNGQNVLDNRGRNIVIPPEANNVIIGATGRISAGRQGEIAQEIAMLEFVQFEDDHNQLEKVGDNQYRAIDGVQSRPATGSIQQGMLERSNTNIVSEMVNMIASYRAYEASSKAVVTQDSLLDKAVNEVGRLS